MEQRQHPRVSVPLVVEISHATLGKRETTARDISDGGVFVYLTDHTLKVGAAIKIKLQATLVNDSQNGPTVDAVVARVEDDGVALSFKNKTAHHLWSSVERLRTELAIGRDYFQVYQALVCRHLDKGILLTQQHGKWGFPGLFLQVDTPPAESRRDYLNRELSITAYSQEAPIAVESFHNPYLPEASTLCIMHGLTLSQPGAQLSPDSASKDLKWAVRPKDVNDLTVSHEWVRDIALKELKSMGLLK